MNLIFDFDGTICDSYQITVDIINEYLKKQNKPPIKGNDLKQKGIENLIKDYKLNRLQTLIFIYLGRKRLAKHITDLKCFNGLRQVIKKLSRKNKLGIISSNSKSNIEKFLINNDLDKDFNFIISSPTIFDKAKKIKLAIKKYKLYKDETFYIGDEVRDLEAARNALVKPISVTWGFASKNLLIKKGASVLINHPKELLELEKLSKP